jgi:hypothetical protein
MRAKLFAPDFVEYIPRKLDEGTLYISERFCTAAHLCACGCGEKVVTPLSPANWRLEKHRDGTVSLAPSIGNWNYVCRSHYWIRQNQVIWARTMSPRQIAQVQERDRLDQAKHVANVNKAKLNNQKVPTPKTTMPHRASETQSLWQRFIRLIGFE